MIVVWPGNKNPRTDYLDPGITLFILKIRCLIYVREDKTAVQAGLLTLGSFYRLRLPGITASGMLQLSFPITAAGPSPTLTGFPVRLYMEHLNYFFLNHQCKEVKEKYPTNRKIIFLLRCSRTLNNMVH